MINAYTRVWVLMIVKKVHQNAIEHADKKLSCRREAA